MAQLVGSERQRQRERERESLLSCGVWKMFPSIIATSHQLNCSPSNGNALTLNIALPEILLEVDGMTPCMTILPLQTDGFPLA